METTRRIVKPRYRLGDGIIGGLLAGAIMAVLAGLGSLMIGQSFVYPFALMGHVFTEQTATPVISNETIFKGIALHAGISLVAGFIFAAIARAVPLRNNLWAWGMLYGVALWGIWSLASPQFNPTMDTHFNSVVMLAGYVAYGIVLGIYVESRARLYSVETTTVRRDTILASENLNKRKTAMNVDAEMRDELRKDDLEQKRIVEEELHKENIGNELKHRKDRIMTGLKDRKDKVVHDFEKRKDKVWDDLGERKEKITTDFNERKDKVWDDLGERKDKFVKDFGERKDKVVTNIRERTDKIFTDANEKEKDFLADVKERKDHELTDLDQRKDRVLTDIEKEKVVKDLEKDRIIKKEKKIVHEDSEVHSEEHEHIE